MGIPVLYQGSQYAPVPFVPIPPDVTPPSGGPQFSSAEIGTVNSFTLVVTFDQDVSASDYSTGVTIKVNGTATSITSATRQSNHAIVRYVIPVLWHGSGDAVTWEYNSATGIIVAELDSTPLGDVSAQSVTNNSGYGPIVDAQADTGITSSVDNSGFIGSGTITQDGNAVTGSGTDFFNQALIGDRLLADDASIDGIITAIEYGSATGPVTLSTSATVASGKTYTIVPQSPYADRVSKVSDAAGSHDFGISIRANKPAHVTDGGGNAVFLDQVTDNYAGQYLADDNVNLIMPFSFLVVAKFDLSQNTGIDVIGKGIDFSRYFDIQFDDSSGQSGATLQQDDSNYYKVVINGIDGYYVLSIDALSGSSLHAYINGNNTGEINSGLGTVTTIDSAATLKIGGIDIELQGNGFSGWVKVVMGFAISDLTTWPTNRAALETRLGARYGLTVP